MSMHLAHQCYVYLWLIAILMIPTSQAHICFWRIISLKDFREVNSLKSGFSIFSGFIPLNCIIHIIQVQFTRFLDYLTIKFGEYYHQRNCRGVIDWNSIVPLDKLLFPVPLLKNSSSADRMGQVLSIGIQYLSKHQLMGEFAPPFVSLVTEKLSTWPWASMGIGLYLWWEKFYQ